MIYVLNTPTYSSTSTKAIHHGLNEQEISLWPAWMDLAPIEYQLPLSFIGYYLTHHWGYCSIYTQYMMMDVMNICKINEPSLFRHRPERLEEYGYNSLFMHTENIILYNVLAISNMQVMRFMPIKWLDLTFAFLQLL